MNLDLGDGLVEWLCDNPGLLPFLKIDACPACANPAMAAQYAAAVEMHLQTQIMRLSHFSNETVETALSCVCAPAPVPAPGIGSSPAARWAWHLFLWTQRKLVRMRKKDLRNATHTIQAIVDLLRDPKLICPGLDVTVNESEFTKSLLKGSMRSFVVGEFQKVVHADYQLERARPLTGDVKPAVLRILAKLSKVADPATFHFPVTNDQEDFEALLFSAGCPFGNERDEIVSCFSEPPKARFTHRILEFYMHLNSVWGIHDGAQTSICIILLFRIFFERAYVANPWFFYPGKTVGLQKLAHVVKLGDLDVEPKFLNGLDMKVTVYTALHDNPLFVECGRFFEAAVFHTNPFDVLHEITQVISRIERHATELRNGGLMPFEVTFGLYVGALLVSGVPNFEELAAFIGDYAPTDGMCPPFEFAAATTAAACRYCQGLRERLG
jgi:hypothetical protein